MFFFIVLGKCSSNYFRHISRVSYRIYLFISNKLLFVLTIELSIIVNFGYILL